MTGDGRTSGPGGGGWVRAGSVAELRRQRTRLVPGPLGDVAVFWNGGEPFAMANICVHQQRELSRGSIFGGRVVCPGHQWAFDTATGYCRERERTQPVYAVRVVGDEVLVETSAPSNADRLALTGQDAAGERLDERS